MLIPIVCPTCRHGGQAPSEYAGRRVRCNKCGQSFPMVAAAPPVAASISREFAIRPEVGALPEEVEELVNEASGFFPKPIMSSSEQLDPSAQLEELLADLFPHRRPESRRRGVA